MLHPAAKPSKRSKPLNWHASSSSQQPPRGHTSMASSGSLKPSLGMLHPAANRHPKATHPWLLMGVQACRLPALKPSKRSKPSKPSKPLKSLKPLKRCWLGNPSPIQACRLPAFKPSKRSKPLNWHASSCRQTLQTLQTLKLACFILQPTATPRPHINGFFWVA